MMEKLLAMAQLAAQSKVGTGLVAAAVGFVDGQNGGKTFDDRAVEKLTAVGLEVDQDAPHRIEAASGYNLGCLVGRCKAALAPLAAFTSSSPSTDD